MPNLIVCTANNVATAARRTLSAATIPADAARPADRALSSGPSPASEATTPAASSRRSSAAGTLRSLPGTPLATIDASRMARPAHTDSATAAPRTPQRRTTTCVSGYPHALSPRTTDPIARFISSALQEVYRSPAHCHPAVPAHRAQSPQEHGRTPQAAPEPPRSADIGRDPSSRADHVMTSPSGGSPMRRSPGVRAPGHELAPETPICAGEGCRRGPGRRRCALRSSPCSGAYCAATWPSPG